jgi:endonuclease/exonuclease/phosphatase family metal-dependent hydrolase
MTIISYNIRYGIANEVNPSNNWDVRKNFLTNYLSGLDGDIVGVQEALWFQLDYLVKNTNNRHYFFTGLGRDDGVHGGEHTAILFDSEKFQVLDGETFWLSDTPNLLSKSWQNKQYRICTWVLFEDIYLHHQFYVFNTHLEGNDEFNINAITLIHQKIAEFTDEAPVFVMGDMNLHPSNISYSYIVNPDQIKPLSDSFVVFHNSSNIDEYSVSYFDANYVPNSENRIDYIFISNHINVTHFEIPKARYGTNQTYSDHYPVVLKCKF